MSDPANEAPDRDFRRRQSLRAVKTFVWVVLITVLIWIYADLEKTETEEFHAKMVLRLGASGDLAFLSGTDIAARDLDVTFRASGSRGGLDRCRRELSERPAALTADVSAYGPGKHSVPVADLLRRAEVIRSGGLTVLSASPDSVGVDLDAAVHVADVEVRPRLPAGGGEPTVRPPRMGLAVAKSRWMELTRSGAKPVLETELLTLPAASADGNKPIRAAVTPFISGVPVLPDEPTVEVVLKVSQSTADKTLTVPVRVQTPPTWTEDDTWQRFVLKREDPLGWQKTITLRGPPKEVEKLRPEDVDAFVPLREDDKKPTEAWLKRDVEVRLPRDSPVQVVGEKPSVLFRLEQRTAGAPDH